MGLFRVHRSLFQIHMDLSCIHIALLRFRWTCFEFKWICSVFRRAQKFSSRGLNPFQLDPLRAYLGPSRRSGEVRTM